MTGANFLQQIATLLNTFVNPVIDIVNILLWFGFVACIVMIGINSKWDPSWGMDGKKGLLYVSMALGLMTIAKQYM